MDDSKYTALRDEDHADFGSEEPKKEETCRRCQSLSILRTVSLLLALSAVVALVGFAAWKVFASEKHKSLNDFLVPEAFFPSCEVFSR